MPRVLYLTETTGHGGAEVVMTRLIQGLRGTEFTPVLGSVGEGWLAEAARPAGAEVVLLDRRSRYDGWDLTAVPRLAALIHRQRVDLVHCFLFHMDVLGTLAARLAGVPVIVSIRSVHYDFETWYRRLAWIVTARLATAITAVSEEAADLLSRHARVSRDRVVVIPNGVDTDVFCPGPGAGVLREAGVPADALVIGTVGRLDPIKGHTFLLDAAAEVVKTHPRCHLVFVGEGPAGDSLAEQASALGLNGRAHFLGARHDVPQLLREMDIFVLPSLSEGMSNALLEAMATGLPVVATSVGGNREVVRHGQTGVLVPRADAKELAAAIARLAGDASTRARLGAAAREVVCRTFSLRSMVEAHHALYAKVVGGDGETATECPAEEECCGSAPRVHHQLDLSLGSAAETLSSADRPILTDIPAARPTTYWGLTTRCCRPQGSLWPNLDRAGLPGRLLAALAGALVLVGGRRKCRAAVVASDMTGNSFALLQSILPLGRVPIVMIDCLWYLPRNRIARWLKGLQLRVEARAVYRFVVWSKHEVQDYARAFGIAEEKLVFVPFHTTLMGYSYSVSTGDYVFSGGNGDRDYATLARAVRGLDVPVTVATSNLAAFRGEPIPPNMRVHPCSHTEFRQLMAGAALVVVPMERGHLHSGGQQTYLNAMAMGKPVIVCDPRGTQGYIEHGKSRIVLDYGDSDGLRRAILMLLSQPDLAATTGQAARASIESGPYSTEACMRAVAALALEGADAADRGRGYRC